MKHSYCALLLWLAIVPGCGREVTEQVIHTAGAAETRQIEVAIVGPVMEGEDLIGRAAPSLDGVRWLDGLEHPLAEDHGKPVLIRWWTDTCPFCENSAPAIRELAEKYGDDLAVRAIYHEKPAGRAVTEEGLRSSVNRLGFPGRIGHDARWPALRRWWLDRERRSFTSVTFLVDGAGLIRMVHTGGEFHDRDHVTSDRCRLDPEQCERSYEALDRGIQLLLAEITPGR